MRVWVGERVLARSIVTGFMVLEAATACFVAQREQDVILAIVPRPEKGTRLGDQLFVCGHITGRHVDSGLALANQIHHGPWRFSRRGQLDLLVVRARDERRIDQRCQRHRLECHRAAVLACYIERRTEFPAIGQVDRGRYLHGIGICIRGVKHHLVPIHIEDIFRGGGTRASGHARVRDLVERGGDFGHPGWHLQMDGVHIFQVALPCDLAAGGLDVESGHIHDRSRRPMIAGDPLRISERQGTGRDGHRQLGMKEVTRRVSCVDFEAD